MDQVPTNLSRLLSEGSGVGAPAVCAFAAAAGLSPCRTRPFSFCAHPDTRSTMPIAAAAGRETVFMGTSTHTRARQGSVCPSIPEYGQRADGVNREAVRTVTAYSGSASPAACCSAYSLKTSL